MHGRNTHYLLCLYGISQDNLGDWYHSHVVRVKGKPGAIEQIKVHFHGWNVKYLPITLM